jgi:hypothetical protein
LKIFCSNKFDIGFSINLPNLRFSAHFICSVCSRLLRTFDPTGIFFEFETAIKGEIASQLVTFGHHFEKGVEISYGVTRLCETEKFFDITAWRRS